MVIWKFQLAVGINTIDMPVGAQLLTVQMQHGYVTVWALVDQYNMAERRVISVVGTGHDLRSCLDLEGLSAAYIGTVQAEYGLVWHVFDGEVS